MDDLFSVDIEEKTKEPRPILVVRLTTSHWHDKNGIHQKKSIRYLKRKCAGFNILDEDCSMTGANEIFPRIVNLKECKDGIYQVNICNESKDWETGYVDDYKYQLVEYKENE